MGLKIRIVVSLYDLAIVIILQFFDVIFLISTWMLRHVRGRIFTPARADVNMTSGVKIRGGKDPPPHKISLPCSVTEPSVGVQHQPAKSLKCLSNKEKSRSRKLNLNTTRLLQIYQRLVLRSIAFLNRL